MGVPLKFYFGNKNYSRKVDGEGKVTENLWGEFFYSFDEGDLVGAKIFEKYSEVTKASGAIYDNIIKNDLS